MWWKLWFCCWVWGFFLHLQILTIKFLRGTLHRLIVLMYICMQVWRWRSSHRAFNLLSLTFALFHNHDFFDHWNRASAVEVQALHGELAGQAMRTECIKMVFWTRNMEGTTFSKAQIILHHHLLTALMSNTLKQKAVLSFWYMDFAIRREGNTLPSYHLLTPSKYYIFSSQNTYVKFVYFFCQASSKT